MKNEKASHETDGCSFMPQVNKKFKMIGMEHALVQERYNRKSKDDPSVEQVYKMLYDKRKESRQDRSPLDIQYEKEKPECTFKPNLFFHNSTVNKIRMPIQNKVVVPSKPIVQAPGPHINK
jgi:hypothetical protein